MILQSAAAATVQTLGFNWQDNPIYQVMPAPYIWYEPSLAKYWTVSDPDSQDGSLYNLGTLQPATFGTNPFHLVDGVSWTPPGGGTAEYMINDSTVIESGEDSLEIAAASDYASTGVSLVAMLNATAATGDDNSVYVGIGGVGFTYKFSNTIAPGIYPSGDLLYSGPIVTGYPSDTNFTCYIATFVEVNVLGTLLTRVQLYKNGTLITTGDIGYSMSSYAASKQVVVMGLNDFNIGSIMRFNYIVSQPQVTTITNYMRTIWGTLA